MVFVYTIINTKIKFALI